MNGHKKGSAEMLDLAKRCRMHGIPLTVQRRVIFDAVRQRKDHPSADQVYESVIDRIPGVSRATVYRTLDTLVTLGLMRRSCHPGTSARFDPNTSRHHHLVCARCGKITDVEASQLDNLALPQVEPSQFSVVDYSVHMSGICGDCQGDQNSGSVRRKTN